DPRGADPPPRPRPGRGGHQPEQHPQGDGREAPGILRKGGPPGLVRAAANPGGRRLLGAGPLHPADGLDAAGWRRRPARFLGPGRRALWIAAAAGRRGGAEEAWTAARQEERTTAREEGRTAARSLMAARTRRRT